MSQVTKLNEILKQTTSMITEDFIVSHVLGIQDEVNRGDWPPETQLSRMFTVEQALAIPDWETDPVVLNEMVSMLIGRTVRAIKLSVDPTNTIDMIKMIPILNSVNDVEQRALKKLANRKD